MTCGQRILRAYADADCVALLVLTTCFAATLNFGDTFTETVAAAQRAGTHVVDGYIIDICYFGPPTSFYPQLIVMAALLAATPAAFLRTVACRLLAGINLTVALLAYVYWWLDSYRVFRNFQEGYIPFLRHPEIRQSAYLYHGTALDLFIALSILACLVLVLDRLFDGEKITSSYLYNANNQP